MITYTDLPLLPTQVIGSHGLPSWMWVVRDAVPQGKLGPSVIDETLRDAVIIALLDMTEAGVDNISDGELCRADFTWNCHGCKNGLESVPFERRLGYPGAGAHLRGVSAQVQWVWRVGAPGWFHHRVGDGAADTGTCRRASNCTGNRTIALTTGVGEWTAADCSRSGRGNP